MMKENMLWRYKEESIKEEEWGNKKKIKKSKSEKDKKTSSKLELENFLGEVVFKDRALSHFIGSDQCVTTGPTAPFLRAH